MDDTEIDRTDAPEAASARDRRLFLRAGVGSAVLSLLPLLGRRASASSTSPPTTLASYTGTTILGATAPGSSSPGSSTPGSSTPGSSTPGSSTPGSTPPGSTSPGSTPATSAPAPTTTAPPQRPTDDDIPLLDFIQSLELAARQLYDGLLAAPGWSADELTVLRTIREGHSGYANSISGLLGRKGEGTPAQSVLDTFGGAFTGDASKLLDAAYELESRVVATHLDALAKLQGTDAAGTLAAIVAVEGRFGTVLAELAGQTDLATLLVTTATAALTPAEG